MRKQGICTRERKLKKKFKPTESRVDYSLHQNGKLSRQIKSHLSKSIKFKSR